MKTFKTNKFVQKTYKNCHFQEMFAFYNSQNYNFITLSAFQDIV